MVFFGFDISWSAQTWAAVASAIAARIAFALSIVNLRTSRRALRISEAQESRRKPSIASYLQDAYIALSTKPRTRLYAVCISLSNKSDNDNGIASAALYLTYAKRDRGEFTIKVSSQNEVPKIFADKSARHLRVPCRVDAHQTISGWAFFAVEDAVLDGADIDATRFAFTDTHGNETIVEPLNVREYRNATETPAAEKGIANR